MKVNGKDYPVYYGKIKNDPNHQPAKHMEKILVSNGLSILDIWKKMDKHCWSWLVSDESWRINANNMMNDQ